MRGTRRTSCCPPARRRSAFSPPSLRCSHSGPHTRFGFTACGSNRSRTTPGPSWVSTPSSSKVVACKLISPLCADVTRKEGRTHLSPLAKRWGCFALSLRTDSRPPAVARESAECQPLTSSARDGVAEAASNPPPAHVAEASVALEIAGHLANREGTDRACNCLWSNEQFARGDPGAVQTQVGIGCSRARAPFLERANSPRLQCP